MRNTEEMLLSQTVVIKYEENKVGEDSQEAKEIMARDIIALSKLGNKVILVHANRNNVHEQLVARINTLGGVAVGTNSIVDNPEPIVKLLEGNAVVVVAMGSDENGDTCNVNLEEQTASIAEVVNADKMLFMIEEEGIYLCVEDKDTKISDIGVSKLEELLERGIVQGHMLKVLNRCIKAIKNGVSEVVMVNRRQENCILRGVELNDDIGTLIHQ